MNDSENKYAEIVTTSCKLSPDDLLRWRGSAAESCSSGDQTQNPITMVTKLSASICNKPRRNAERRGLRSTQAIKKRRKMRTAKRRLARRAHRSDARAKALDPANGAQQENSCRKTAMTRARPNEATEYAERIPYADVLTIGSFNVCGMRQAAKREMLEIWMEEKGVKICALQETRTRQNSREVRKRFTWFFSGEGGDGEYVHK